MADQFQLRVYSYLDRMQPQYAAFVGTITQGDLPTEGMAALYIEVAPGNEVEFALKTMPGKVIKGKVDSVVWAQGQGTMMASGDLPSPQLVQNQPPGKFAVKFDVNERNRLQFLAAGAAGDVAIYTEHLHAIHLIRKVILRVGSYLNYLILKLH